MNARGSTFILVIAIAAFTAGCAHATTRAASETVTTSHVVGNAAVTPFVPSTPPLAHPPAATLWAGTATGRPTPFVGSPYTGDWNTDGTDVATAPRVPVPWPKPSAGLTQLGRSAVVAGLMFKPDSVPDHLVIHAYAHVDRTTGVPTGAPNATFECSRFHAPECPKAYYPFGHFLGGIPRSVLTSRYITVFGIWHGDVGSPQARSASWLFVGDDPATGARSDG